MAKKNAESTVYLHGFLRVSCRERVGFCDAGLLHIPKITLAM